MRKARRPSRPLSAAAVCAVIALPALADVIGETRQATNSSGDTSVQRFSPPGTKWAALLSDGDLTPGAPGNADGSTEVYRLNTRTLELLQVTSSQGDSQSVKVTAEGDVIVSSREDLTPGAPGNTDGSFEAWIWDAETRDLRQISATEEDTFFQTFWDSRRQAFFVSKGDLTPGDPGNTTGHNEVFRFDVATGQLEQLTAGSRESIVRAIGDQESFVVIESGADLVEDGNPDGSKEVFLLDIDGNVGFVQLTASLANSTFAGKNPTGRFIAIESRGDLVTGGNPDSTQEVFVYDRRTKTLIQATKSEADTEFVGFIPRSNILVVRSGANLVTGQDDEGGEQVFFVDLKRETVTRVTQGPGDSTFSFIGPRTSRWAVLETTHENNPENPDDDTTDVFLVRLTREPKRFVPVVRDSEDVHVDGFDRDGTWIAFDTTASPVAGGNTDGSREVFLQRVGNRPVVRQVTSTALDSRVGGFASDGRRLLVESRASLDPAGAGNADATWEVFVHRYR